MRKSIVFLSLLLGTAVLANCGGDDDVTPPVQEAGVDGAVGTGGNKVDSGGTGGTQKDSGTDASTVPVEGGGGGGGGGATVPDAASSDVTIQEDAKADATSEPDAAACPNTAPQDDTSCPSSLRGENCAYGAVTCRCRTSTGKWTCSEDAGPKNDVVTTPDVITQDVVTHDVVTNDVVADVTVDVNIVGADVVVVEEDAGDASAEAGPCPANEPEDEASCTNVPARLECEYSAVTCLCGTGGARKWLCAPTSDAALNDAGCPLTLPADGTYCAEQGTRCNVAGKSCRCRRRENPNTWLCE